MPNFFAITKCPVSCSITDKSSATTKMTTPSASIRSCLSRRPLRVQLARPPPGPVIDGQHVGDVRHGRTRNVMLRDYPGHGVDYAGETDPARQKVRHAGLVGGVVDGRRGTARRGRLAGEPDRGK